MNSAISDSLHNRLSDCEPVLNHVNIALKCLQLYPENHATTKAAIDKLWLVFVEYFSRHGHLDFRVTQDGLLMDDRPIGPNSAGMKSLALLLYRLKLDHVLIQAEIDRRQLVDLLMIVCMDPDDVFKAGGVKELLWQRQISGVAISQAYLKLTQEIGTSDAAEAQAILMAQKALVSKYDVSGLEHQLIKQRLEQGPGPLAEFLQTLGGLAEDDDRAGAILKIALPKIDALVKRELADEQAFLYRNLAEALMLMDEPLRTQLATMLAADGKSSRATTGRLVEQLTGEELAELLNLAVSANNLPQARFIEFVENMPIKPEHLRDLIPFLKRRVSITDDEAERLLDISAVRMKETTKKAIPIEGIDAAKIAALAVALDPLDLERVETEAAGMNEFAIEEGALAALAEVLSLETNPARLTRASHAIQRVLLSAFTERRLSAAGAALSVIVNEVDRRRKESDDLSTLKEIIRDAGQPDKIENLLSWVENQQSVSFDDAVHYLSLIGNPGILTLLDMLATEKRQGRRRLVCQMLTACSRANIASLGSKIMDHRWYLVRNVVYVLGRIGDDNSLVYLQKAVSHPDPRVRIEVAKALSNIGPAAMPALLDLLGDKDLNIKLEAIRAVAQTKDPRATEIFTGLINQRDMFMRRIDTKVEAIEALGRLKAGPALPLLMKLATSRSRFFKAQRARLVEAARNAMAKIQGSADVD